MAILSQLSEDKALAIISLPYKAALWVSHADDIGGEDDDENEMKAISRGIPALAELFSDSLLVQEVASEIMRLKDDWNQWEEECFYILKQAPEIMRVIQTEFGTDEAKCYRRFVMELGKKVAQAHSELSAFDTVDEGKKEGFLNSVLGKFMGGISSTKEDNACNPANISPSEKSALSQLSSSLKIAD